MFFFFFSCDVLTDGFLGFEKVFFFFFFWVKRFEKAFNHFLV
jgi:hypothetical protein